MVDLYESNCYNQMHLNPIVTLNTLPLVKLGLLIINYKEQTNTHLIKNHVFWQRVSKELVLLFS
jgi:hypothetical protein